METTVIGAADVHARTAAHGLKSLKYLDLRRRIGAGRTFGCILGAGPERLFLVDCLKRQALGLGHRTVSIAFITMNVILHYKEGRGDIPAPDLL